MRIAKTTLDIIITGKLIDTETVMISLEGGGWKSASNGNSLATYPTASTVPNGRGDAVMHTSTLPQQFLNREQVGESESGLIAPERLSDKLGKINQIADCLQSGQQVNPNSKPESAHL